MTTSALKSSLLLSLISYCSFVSALAPLEKAEGAQTIANEYIVVLKSGVSAASSDGDMVEKHLSKVFPDSVTTNNHNVLHRYAQGYAAVFDDDTLQRVREFDEVEFVEPNSVVYLNDVQQNPLNWGLDRISHRELPLKKEYVYGSKAGDGVTVYVVDTGINIGHDDFEGRASWGLTAPAGDEDRDGNGHGTHVSSTIVGSKYGIAKNADVVAVKVLRSSGYGSMSDVLRGVDFVATNHTARVKSASESKVVKSVANMSLGGGKSRALDRAVEKAIEEGVLFAVAAGNDNRNACRYSPAAAKAAMTVGATDKYDKRSYFSNYGKCVDIFAPGSDITAAWIGSATAKRTISGTSMASPHVCGVMALVLGEHESLTPEELKQKVLEMSTDSVVKNPGRRSPNKLLFNGGENMDKPDQPAEPEPEPETPSGTVEIFIGKNGRMVSGMLSRLLALF